MSSDSFDRIMMEITAGLTGDPDHDIPYLQSKTEQFKDHSLSQEILRACGRLIWDCLPEDKKSDLHKTLENRESGTDSILQEAHFNLTQGQAMKSLELLEPLIEQYDDLIEKGWNENDSESVYFDFGAPIEEIIWKAHSDEKRDVRKTTEPFFRAYLLYGSCLYELHQHEKAIEALKQACRWNPASACVYFEIGENYKQLGNIEMLEKYCEEAFPFIGRKEDFAKYHREKGYIAVEQGEFRKAAAHNMYSLLFEHSNLALSEVMFIKMQHGEDYTDMTIEESENILAEYGEQTTADEETLSAFSSIARYALDNDDLDLAIYAMTTLYELSRNETYGELLEELISLDDSSGNAEKK